MVFGSTAPPPDCAQPLHQLVKLLQITEFWRCWALSTREVCSLLREWSFVREFGARFWMSCRSRACRRRSQLCVWVHGNWVTSTSNGRPHAAERGRTHVFQLVERTSGVFLNTDAKSLNGTSPLATSSLTASELLSSAYFVTFCTSNSTAQSHA